MRPRLRYALLTAARTRTPLAPLAVTFLLLIGTYASPRNEPGATFGLTALALTVVFIGYPLALRKLAVANLFEPVLRPGDVAVAALGHLCCSALGGAVGVLFAPPRVTRRATATASVLATLLALIAISRPLGAVGGPAAVAQTLSDAAAGTVDGAELAAALSCLALAGASFGAVGWWARRYG